MADFSELSAGLDLLEKEKGIPRNEIIDAIAEGLKHACRQQIANRRQVKPENVNVDNIHVTVDYNTCEYHILEAKQVVNDVVNPDTQISLQEAHDKYGGDYVLGQSVNVEINSMDFSRVAVKTAKETIVQKIKEVEKLSVIEEFKKKIGTIVTGVVERYAGRNISINLGRCDALLMESDQIKGEHYNPTDHIRVLVVDVKDGSEEDRLKKNASGNEKKKKRDNGPRIRLSRSHPDFIKCLFAEEVSEIRDGIVEIKAVSREAGNRSKIAVASNDPDVDPVGACVGMNGSRVNAVVSEIGNEKIDIIEWSDQPAQLIENALAPAKVIAVVADADLKQARVVVPDYQLSLAIGREGQNARLAARLTGFKIDIKSETQAEQTPGFMTFDDIYGPEDDVDPDSSDDMDDAEDIDSSDDMDDAEDIDSPDDMDDAEDIDSSDDIDDAEDIDSPDDIDDAEDIDASDAEDSSYTNNGEGEE